MSGESSFLGLFFDPDLLWEYRWDLLLGFWVTIQLAFVTLAVSLLPALLVALARQYGPRILQFPLIAFVSLIRSVPAVVTLVFVYFALPFTGVAFDKFYSVVFTLSLVQVVYMSEVFRGALESVERGQFEAGTSLGLGMYTILRRIVFPQTFAVAAPAFASSIIQLVQNTTIASVVALADLLGEALNVQTVTGSPAAVLASAILYLVLLLPLVRIVRMKEQDMARAR